MYRNWAQDLYSEVREILVTLEKYMEDHHGATGEIPNPPVEKSKDICALFDSVLSRALNIPSSKSSDYIDGVKRNSITEMMSQRVKELGVVANDAITLAQMDDDDSWAVDILQPTYRKVVGLFSIAGAINADHGNGLLKDSELTSFYFSNEEIIIFAFLNLDDPVQEFLSRANGSDLGIFGGILLALATRDEAVKFEKRRMANFDRNPNSGLEDYSDFIPFSLISMLSVEQELPNDFWPTYFEAVYPIQNSMPDLCFPGSKKWIDKIGRSDLFEALAKKYPEFKLELNKAKRAQTKGTFR